MYNRHRLGAGPERLSDDLTGLSEVRHVTAFKAYRGDDRVTVEIVDSVDVHPSMRYLCYVTTEGDRVATGEPAESPEMAILTTHWNKLDKG